MYLEEEGKGKRQFGDGKYEYTMEGKGKCGWPDVIKLMHVICSPCSLEPEWSMWPSVSWIHLLARRNLLWDILRLPSSRRAALGLYVILTLWWTRGANQRPYALLHIGARRAMHYAMGDDTLWQSVHIGVYSLYYWLKGGRWLKLPWVRGWMVNRGCAFLANKQR